MSEAPSISTPFLPGGRREEGLQRRVFKGAPSKPARRAFGGRQEGRPWQERRRRRARGGRLDKAGLPPSLMSLAMNFSRSLASLAAAASAFCAAFTSATFCSSGVSTFSSAIEPKMQDNSPNFRSALLAGVHFLSMSPDLAASCTSPTWPHSPRAPARRFSRFSMGCTRFWKRGLQSTLRSATPRS